MQVRVKKAYEVKHSVRYNATDGQAAVQSVYIMKQPLQDAFAGYPEELVITIEKA